MVSLVPSRAAFLRDSLVAGVVFGVTIAVARLSVGPSALQAPGRILSLPLVLVYIFLGGETEWPHGPSAIQAGLYVVALALLVGWVAYLVREHVTIEGQSLTQFTALAAIAVVATAAVLLTLVFLPGVSPMAWFGVAAVAVVGLLGAAAVLWLRERRT
jgi:hypothetical protein